MLYSFLTRTVKKHEKGRFEQETGELQIKEKGNLLSFDVLETWVPMFITRESALPMLEEEPKKP